MKRTRMLTCGLAGALWAAAAMYGAEAAAARKPVLLELFTSEGCSSCPPADRLLASYDSGQPFPGVELIVLSEHVDYWNRLGWTDPYSSPQFTARQQDYVAKLRLQGAYTPQLLVDGQKDVVGSDGAAARAAILEAAKRPKSSVELKAVRSGMSANVKFGVSGGAPKADVYVALANDRVESKVARGENSGRNLQHVAVIRKLVAAGKTDAHGILTQQLTLPLMDGGAWRVVVFLADPDSKRVLGAAQIRL